MNIFYMQDTYALYNAYDDDCSFHLQTDAPKKVVEELVWVANRINKGTLEEIQEKYDNKYNNDWDEYYPISLSVYEILFALLEDRNYYAKEITFETIEW